MTRFRIISRAGCMLLSAFALVLMGLLPSKLSRAAEPAVEKDTEYGFVANTHLLMDVYRPSPDAYPGKRPGIVLIHGGGFIGGDKSFYAPMAVDFARHGYVAFSLNYRLAPTFHYPAQVDDAQRAVRWIRSKSAAYSLDPDRLGALGDSAGGYLVTMLGARPTRDNSDPALSSFSSNVSCVFDLYGPSDFTLPASTSGINPQALQLLFLFFGKTQDQASDLYKDGSPVQWVDKKSAPFLIIHGTADPLVPDDQSRRLCDALKTAGVEATLIEFYKFEHGFLHPSAPGQIGLLADDFFRTHLKP